MSTDPLDLADPIRLVILLLPERYRAPAAVLLSALIATQAVAAVVVARLPLSAREHPRYGWLVRALHRYSVARLRDEPGSLKMPGAGTASGVAPALPSRDTVAPPVPTPTEPSDRLPGAVTVSELLGCLVVAAIVVVIAHGCGPLTEAALRATPGVPPPAACVAGAQRCGASDGGAVPEVCSGTGRWWPALARSADGRQRVCPAGCAVTDAGVAYCAAGP